MRGTNRKFLNYRLQDIKQFFCRKIGPHFAPTRVPTHNNQAACPLQRKQSIAILDIDFIIQGAPHSRNVVFDPSRDLSSSLESSHLFRHSGRNMAGGELLMMTDWILTPNRVEGLRLLSASSITRLTLLPYINESSSFSTGRPGLTTIGLHNPATEAKLGPNIVSRAILYPDQSICERLATKMARHTPHEQRAAVGAPLRKRKR